MKQLDQSQHFETKPDDEDITPKQETKTNEVFASYLATDSEGLIYTDLTGKFLITSLHGNTYVLLLYHNKGFAPKLHIIDNKASTALKRQIKRMQKIIGSFLYLARAVNIIIIKTLNSLAS